jgi:hypothetical protein
MENPEIDLADRYVALGNEPDAGARRRTCTSVVAC